MGHLRHIFILTFDVMSNLCYVFITVFTIWLIYVSVYDMGHLHIFILMSDITSNMRNVFIPVFGIMHG